MPGGLSGRSSAGSGPLRDPPLRHPRGWGGSGAAGSGTQRGPCVSAGIDKENVELSPTAGHANSGRMRHGSASQVQKQRSAGSFKRHSIKKIV